MPAQARISWSPSRTGGDPGRLPIRTRPSPGCTGRGFTVIDVLVTLAVVLILIGLLLPTMSVVRETTRRVVCSSNVRQVGLGLAMYADQNDGLLPQTIFAGGNAQAAQPQEMMTLRIGERRQNGRRIVGLWDGIGRLFDGDYLNASKLFYCPSHTGNHPFQRYETQWAGAAGEIVGNYHFRGVGPNGSRLLREVLPESAALVADGMRTAADYNHKVGTNVLRADLHVFWFTDATGVLAASLPPSDRASSARSTEKAWDALDAKR